MSFSGGWCNSCERYDCGGHPQQTAHDRQQTARRWNDLSKLIKKETARLKREDRKAK